MPVVRSDFGNMDANEFGFQSSKHLNLRSNFLIGAVRA